MIRPFAFKEEWATPFEVPIRTKDGEEILWTMGMAAKIKTGVEIPSPRLRAADWHVFFAILRLHDGTEKMVIRVGEIARELGMTDGAENFRRIREALNRLTSFRIRRETERFILDTMLLRADWQKEKVGGRESEKIERVWIHEDFLSLARDGRMKQRFDVLCGFGSDLAISLYMWLPGHAHRATEDAPYRISLSKLAGKLGDGAMKPYALRNRLLKHGERSILSQIDGKPIKDGSLRVSVDGDSLLAWRQAAKRRDGKLRLAFLGGCPRGDKSVEAWNADYDGLVSSESHKLGQADEAATLKFLGLSSLSGGQRGFLDEAARILRTCCRREDAFLSILAFAERQASALPPKGKWAILSTMLCEVVAAVPKRADFPAGWWRTAALARLEKARSKSRTK